MSIVQAIFDRNYEHAGEILEESFINLLERKMCEAKKRVAAKMECAMPSLPSVEKAKRGLSEDGKLTNRVSPTSSPYGDLSGAKKVFPNDKEELDHMNRDKDGNTVVEEDQINEGRIRIIKARMRNGKIQRRKKVSNVPGMKLIGGQLKRMSASERRSRKLGAKKAARKDRGKRSQMLRKRKMTLAKKSRLGI